IVKDHAKCCPHDTPPHRVPAAHSSTAAAACCCCSTAAAFLSDAEASVRRG
ncbi:unnamed protein product, partial [Ectocarpus sp. 13 AM-2016]